MVTTGTSMLFALTYFFLITEASFAFQSATTPFSIVKFPLNSALFEQKSDRFTNHKLHNFKQRNSFNDNLNRRVFISYSLIFSSLIETAPYALASYGDSTNIELPSYIDFLIEKNKAVDSSKFLYQGPDSEILIGRIGEASSRLKSIPILIEQKKWSQVQGVLTGPLGTLVQTMNQISSGTQKKEVAEAGKKVKNDLIAINQAAAQKNGPLCLKATMTSVDDLDEFVKLAF